MCNNENEILISGLNKKEKEGRDIHKKSTFNILFIEDLSMEDGMLLGRFVPLLTVNQMKD